MICYAAGYDTVNGYGDHLNLLFRLKCPILFKFVFHLCGNHFSCEENAYFMREIAMRRWRVALFYYQDHTVMHGIAKLSIIPLSVYTVTTTGT